MTEVINTGLALFFLVTLILIQAMRKRVHADELPSYNRMANGAVVLAVMAVANLFVGSGVLDGVPVIGDRATAGFILWIVAMVGTVMLVSGVSHWLPVSRRHRDALQRRTERMEVINKMSRFLATDSRTEAVLSAAVRFIEQHMPYSRLAVYTISQKHRETNLVASYSNSGSTLGMTDLSFDPERLSRLGIADMDDPSSLFTARPETIRIPDQMVPLTVGSRAVGFFLLWEDAAMRDSEACRATVTQVGRMISNHIASQRLSLETDYRRRREQLQTALMTAIDPTITLSENFVNMARLALEREPASLVSLTLPKHWPGHQRITAASNDAILQEKNVCPDLTDDILQQLFEDGRPIIIRDAAAGQPDWIRPFIPGDAPGSLLLLPVVVREQVQAVVTIAVDISRTMTAAQQSIFEAVVHPVATLLQTEHFRLQAAIQVDRLAKVGSFSRRATNNSTQNNLFQHAANLLGENIDCSMVRISTYDTDGKFLTSRALHTHHTVDSVTPDDGAMILSLMPMHRMVRETGRTQLVNQLIMEQRMEESECHQVLSSTLGSALLVPIVRNGRTKGVISIGEQRDYNRSHLGATDVTFVEAIAAALSAHVGQHVDSDRSEVVELPNDETGELSYLRVLREIESSGPFDDHQERKDINRVMITTDGTDLSSNEVLPEKS